MAEYTIKSSKELPTTRTRMGIDATTLAYLEWLVLEDAERQAKYKEYRRYYDGDHDVMLTERQKAFLELTASQEFSANYCSLVVDELERRMTVSGFEADGNRELGGESGQLWKWWRLARMDSKQSDTHLAATRDGDAYVIVSWDQVRGRPAFHANMAFDGSEGVKVHYSDETGEVEFASKRWVIKLGEDVARTRMNLYYPDRVERWVSDGKGWEPYSSDGKDDIMSWINPRTRAPLGVPVFHLKYKPAGYRWGRSILEDVIPMQNALNKAIVDVIAAADTTGFRLYWATGTDLLDDDEEPISIHPGTWIVATAPDARVGYMPGEDLRPLIEVVDMCKVSIAQVSETPMHLFQVSGQNASEGAQKQQEVGMINKAEKLGISIGNFWEDCMGMAIKLSNAFDNTSYPEDLILSTNWADMEVRDKTTRRQQVAETAKTWVDAGSSLEEAAKEAGVPAERATELGSNLMLLMPGVIPGGNSAETEPDDTA
jgi:hypothetical protein